MKRGTYTIQNTDGIIVVHIVGYVDRILVDSIHIELKKISKKLNSIKAPVLICLNINEVTGHNSAARLSGKNLLQNITYERLAIWTSQKILSSIAMYIVRLAKPGKPTKVFRSELSSIDWLKGKSVNHTSNRKPTIWILAILLFSQMVILLNWKLINQTVARVDVNQVDVSIYAVISFAIIYSCLLLVERTRFLKTFYRLAYGSLSVVILLNGANLLLKLLDTSFQFKDLLKNVGHPAALAVLSPATSIGIIFASIITVVLLHYSHINNEPPALIRKAVRILILLLGAFGIIPFLFIAFSDSVAQNIWLLNGYSTITGISLVFLFFILAHIWLRVSWQEHKINSGHLFAVFVMTIIAILTGYLWQTSKQTLVFQSQQNTKDVSHEISSNIKTRVDDYISAINGYSALFAASDEVTADEFETFFQSRSQNSNFPGITALSFISRIENADRKSYIDRFNGDRLYILNNITIKNISPIGERPVYYPVTYIAPFDPKVDSYGFDLSVTTRFKNLQFAEETNSVSASGPLDLNDLSDSDSKRSGFFVTIPVRQRGYDSTSPPFGFVNAVFEHKLLLDDVFDSNDESIHFSISDEEIFYENNRPSIKLPIEFKSEIQIANRKWDLTVYAPENYGISGPEQNSPIFILIIGFTFNLIITGLFLTIAGSQSRARRIASSMTEDLEFERNQLAGKTAQSEALVNSIGEGLIVTNARGVITEVNPVAEKLLNQNKQELVGKWYPDVVQLFDNHERAIPQDERPELQALLTGEIAESKEYNLTLPDKSLPVSITASPYVQEGHPVGVVIAIKDITAERELENAKDDFLGLASHQLRTPATAVKQYIGLLLDGYAGDLTEEQTEALQAAHDSNERQIDIVQDMLSVARLESGKLEPSLEPINLTEIVQASFDEQKSVIDSRNQTVDIKLETNIKTDGDEKLLRMVVENLISNASKYTPPDGSLKIRLEKHTSDIKLIVTDSGVGISKQDQMNLFKRFSRIKNELSEVVGGSGLGLYIAQKIANLHGGKITVESEIKKGTTFTLSLPGKLTEHDN